MRRYFVVIYVAAAWALVAVASAHAAVRINEIAWMGTSKSSTAEWIELANTGAKKVSLAGWTLRAAGGSPHIVFPSSANISAHGYFLLERTRNGAVPGVVADLVYKGGLSNTGETLTLTNSASTTVNRVTSGKNWCLLGGNNKTKETAQYTTNGWITATGTPRSANATSGTKTSCIQKQSAASGADKVGTAFVEAATTSAAATVPPKKHTNGPPTYEKIPVVYVHIKASHTAVAGADMKFRAIVSDAHGHLYPLALVHFAFGDGSSSNSTQMFKSYKVPGTYLVTATAIDGLGSGEDEMTVVVHRTSVRIISVSHIGISLKNNSQYLLDLSTWKLHSATTTFSFPEGTKILPYTTVLFPYEITKLHYAPQTTRLLYPGGKVAVLYNVNTLHQKALPMKPHTKTIGCNNTQGACPVVHTIILQANVIQHGNATVTAPAVKVKAFAAGALVDTANSVSHTTNGTSVAAHTTNSVAPTVSHGSFFTLRHIFLMAVVLAFGAAIMAL